MSIVVKPNDQRDSLGFIKSIYTLDTLLETKLHIPTSAHRLIDRPHLLQRLEVAATGKLTLVCAPAGFGKSSLVSQWLQQSNHLQRAWLSLDAADNDLRSFMTYLVAALQQTDEQIGRVTQSMLQAPQLPTIATLVTPLINDIAEMSESLILALDDYHVINLQDIHDAIGFLLSHLPPQLHLVILSRHDPPLELGRLRAQGKMKEFRSAELRFNRKESCTFFQIVMDTPLSPEQVNALESRTEGWVAGLQLAGLALQGHPEPNEFISKFSGDHSYIVDYLEEEVLNQQSTEVCTFLLKTACLDRLNASLCNAVTENTNSQKILTYLHQENLFLVSLDGNRQWYRYHHLFADLLKYQLEQAYPEQISDIHQRASRWYHANGFVSEAIHHALTGEAYDFAADLIEQVGLKMVGQAHLNSLKKWIDALPQQLVKKRPYLGVFLAWGSVLIGKSNDAIEQLKMAEASIEQVKKSSSTWLEITCQLNLLQGYISRNQGDLISAIEQTKKAQAYLPEDNVFLQCTVNLNLGGNYRLTGDLVTAEDAFYRAAAFVNHTESEYPALAAAGFLAGIYLQTGRLRQAKRHCQQTIETEISQRSHPLPAIAYLYVEQGSLFYEQNNLAAAEKVLESAIKLGKNVDRVVNIVRATQLIALLKQAKGEAEEAKKLIQSANTLFESGTRYQTMRQIEFDYYRVQLWLLRGEIASASRWARDYQPRAINSSWNILNELSFSRILLVNHQPEKALGVLQDCTELAQSLSIIGWVIQALVLKARCYQTLNNHKQALQSLAYALSLAEPEGYIRTFVDEGTPLIDLLTQLLTHYDDFNNGHNLFSAEYVSQLLSIIKLENSASKPLLESLSNREKNVLRLLVAGLSNQKIADELAISIGTVKQYNHVIYRKLDAHTRDQAVQRAKEHNLL